MSPFEYKPLEQDYRIWLVVNPATWLIPILLAVFIVALFVHSYAFSLPGRSWADEAPAPVVEQPAAEAPAE